MLMTLISDGARSMISEPENSALARSQGPEEPVLDSCKFQGFVAKFSRYLPCQRPLPQEPTSTRVGRLKKPAFDVGTTGDWLEYTPEDIDAAIYQCAGCTNMESTRTFAA